MTVSNLRDGQPLLEVEHLSVWAGRVEPKRFILEDISFSLGCGELVVVLGESGSGKTPLARAITRLFPENSGIELDGTISFMGKPVHDDASLSLIRRRNVRYVFQHPLRSLNPTARIRTQLRNASTGGRPSEEELRVILNEVGLPRTKDILDSYPHQLSVGMAQRVALAMAILPRPGLLIADEPTSALDAPLRIQLLDLLKAIQSTHQMSIILVTHDLDLALGYADRIIVLYAGRIVEVSGFRSFFETPLHPYSRIMQASRRVIEERLPLEKISDRPPDVAVPVRGCRFSPRCPLVQSKCLETEPELETINDGRSVRCFYWK